MSDDEKKATRHLRITEPSPWVRRFAPLIAGNGVVLDLACGGGRHAGLMLDLHHRVLAVDKATDAIRERLGTRDGLEIVTTDLEDGRAIFDGGGVLAGRRFTGIVVVNYLHRPLLAGIVAALESGGVLIYETFGRGNDAYSKPRNPDHLLIPGELPAACGDTLRIVAYEHGIEEDTDLPGVKSRICAIRVGPDAPPVRLHP